VDGWTIGGLRIVQACAIGYAGWKGAELKSSAEVESFFCQVCERASENLNDPGICGPFITWFDANRREFVFPLLLSEVNRAIAYRMNGEQLSLIGVGAAEVASEANADKAVVP
jgi:hypothetical protein